MVQLAENYPECVQGITVMPPSAKLYVPLSQHIGKICDSLVKTGDYVYKGQKIGDSSAKVFAAVHAPVSGTVVGVEDWPHPVIGRCKAVIIDNDHQEKINSVHVPGEDAIAHLSAEAIRSLVFEAGIVGMGGASFPTFIKLNSSKPLDSLIINGAECEPYLSADNCLMLENGKEIIAGIELIRRCTNVKNIYIAIEDNKPEAIDVFRKLCRGRDYHVKPLVSDYPQGGERQLIKSILRREVPSGKLPFDVGVLVHNVATVYAIYGAVYLAKPLFERVVTVAGDCFKTSRNCLIRVGTPIKDIVSFCGPLVKDPKKIVFGGPMMGVAQFSLETPIIKSTDGVLAFFDIDTKPEVEMPCVRCTRCVRACPAGLLPCMIAMASEKEKWDLAKAYGCLDCIECGACDYVCPQEKNLVQAIRQAKVRSPR
ncbi:MAG TPA: electron transport complex subunit RsxC [Candidatus Omnitrophota bacterium]|nr:electron transport complex subunit RsxC [Candidatus Omnitrophota bacterium]HPT07440.1 electron transport complex subunit RsxC [Candidatus Omnitrophota bacterium]